MCTQDNQVPRKNGDAAEPAVEGKVYSQVTNLTKIFILAMFKTFLTLCVLAASCGATPSVFLNGATVIGIDISSRNVALESFAGERDIQGSRVSR